MEIRGRHIVMEFVYLGSLLTWDNDCNKEIKRRIARANGVMAGFETIWNSKHISTETKISIIRTCVMSVLLYACETRTSENHTCGGAKTRNIVQHIMKRKLSLFGWRTSD